ncbi:MAG: hypothetical protein GTN64_08565 [Candidatus Latescibacteria bacterium]|nr:hypothetical protein [Candidatus Latescibacterota bacterium]NIO78651.1 hypothetical protein [Candidatus Latescibacterota bacterium]
MKMQEWLDSKKTKDMLLVIGTVSFLTIAAMAASGGSAIETKEMIDAIGKPLDIILAAGGLKLVGQSVVDTMKEKNGKAPVSKRRKKLKKKKG